MLVPAAGHVFAGLAPQRVMQLWQVGHVISSFAQDQGVLGQFQQMLKRGLARPGSCLLGDSHTERVAWLERGMGVQEVEAEAAGVCATLGLPLPLSVAQREAPGKRLAAALLAALEQPERELPIPLTPSLQARPTPVRARAHPGRRWQGLHRPASHKCACAFCRAPKQGTRSGARCLNPDVRKEASA